MKKKISVLMALVLMMSIIFGVNVSAAVSYPAISSSAYIEFKAQQNINVYKDTACKIRGTSSPLKAYNASVATGDVCYIYKITSSYIQINYPTASGRRIGYIKRADLFDKTVPEEYISSAKASVTVYKAEGSSSIAKGDKVWRVDPKMGYSGYRAVIYEAKSGKRAYKMGYITLADLEKIKQVNTKSVSNNSSSENTNTSSQSSSLMYAKYSGVDYTKLTDNSKRIAALDKAKKMVTVQWTAPCDFVTWASSKGILNTTTSVDNTSATKFVKGKIYTGVPYSMNSSGSRTLDDIAWIKLLNNGINTSMMSGNYYSKKAGTKYGIDCSAFVCKAYEAATGTNLKLNTSSMLNSKKFKKLSDFSKLKPGDVFLKAGHVMMYVGKSGSSYAVFEASAGGSKCRYKTYTSAELKSYCAYKYIDLGD